MRPSPPTTRVEETKILPSDTVARLIVSNMSETTTSAFAAALLCILTLSGCGTKDSRPWSNDPPAAGNTARDGNDDTLTTRTAARFTDMAEKAGVCFVHRNGEEVRNVSILESLGGGAGLLDYDADGDLDIFFPGGGSFGRDQSIEGLCPALFRNQGPWRFQDVTGPSGLDQARFYSHGVCVGDFNSDGFPDVLVTGYGGLLLYQNQGDGRFCDVTSQAMLNDRLWSTSAAWGDLDDDGNLDLYVVHYVNWSFANDPFCSGPKPGQREICPPREFDPLPDTLYHNEGDGSFGDISHDVGLRIDGNGLGVLTADVDLDGDLDVYVGNDAVGNFLYRNDGRGVLEEVGLQSGASLGDAGNPDGSMGVDMGDFNLDGFPDLFAANFERESFALYRNLGNCYFQHSSRQTGITAVGGLYVGWGTAFFDFDRDMDEDIFVATGHVVHYPGNTTRRQPSLLFENVEGRRFINVAPAAGDYTASPHMARGVATGDLDDDGDIDIVVSQTNERAALLRNDTQVDGHWLLLRLIGVHSNRDAVGALVRLSTASGTQVRQRKGGGSYASSSDSRLFFGLGPHREISRLEIRWPSGRTRILEDVDADQFPTGRRIAGGSLVAVTGVRDQNASEFAFFSEMSLQQRVKKMRVAAIAALLATVIQLACGRASAESALTLACRVVQQGKQVELRSPHFVFRLDSTSGLRAQSWGKPADRSHAFPGRLPGVGVRHRFAGRFARNAATSCLED